jgi:hypothetical protein
MGAMYVSCSANTTGTNLFRVWSVGANVSNEGDVSVFPMSAVYSNYFEMLDAISSNNIISLVKHNERSAQEIFVHVTNALEMFSSKMQEDLNSKAYSQSQNGKNTKVVKQVDINAATVNAYSKYNSSVWVKQPWIKNKWL